MTLAAALLLGGATIARAQQPSEEHVRDLIRQAAAKAEALQQPATGGSAGQNANQSTVRLSLDDVIKMTLDRNLNIAVQRLNPQINDIAVASAYTVYHPTLTSLFQQGSNTALPTNQTSLAAGGAGPVTDTVNYNVGLTQLIRKTGGNVGFTLNGQRQTTTSASATCTPCYQPVWTANLTQPLLRNFAIDTNRQTLQISIINRDMSDVTLRASITNTVANAQRAYWEYVYASQNVEVAQSSLDIANRLVADNNTRVEVGTMAPLDVVTAQTQAATAQQTLVAARATQRTNEIALKQFVVTGTADPTWNAHIEAVDQPEFNPQPIDLETVLRRALSERTDLALAKMQVQENDITLKYLNNQTKPQADFQATYGLSGIGGDLITRSGGLNSSISSINSVGITNAYSTLLQNAYPRWTVGLNISYPLFMSAQQASVQRARVQLNQVDTQLKQAELQVATDIANAVTNVNSAVEAVRAAKQSVELSTKQLEAEQSKFDVGMSTNYNVVLAQQTLASSRQSELRAEANYREALVELDRLQQTTLTNANITVLGR
jgi:outer membrane protein TolC